MRSMSKYHATGPNMRRAQGGVCSMVATRHPCVIRLTLRHTVRQPLRRDEGATASASEALPLGLEGAASALAAKSGAVADPFPVRSVCRLNDFAVPKFMMR